MRRLYATLLAVFVLCWGAALAQVTTVDIDSDVDVGSQYWGGISLGVPFGVNFHIGAEDMLAEGVDMRANVSAGFSGVFGVGGDILFDLPVDTADTPIDIYAGGGLAVKFGDLDNDPVTDNATGFSLGLMAGLEYRLTNAGLPEGGIFAEVGPAINFGGGQPSVSPNAKLGFNYHF